MHSNVTCQMLLGFIELHFEVFSSIAWGLDS